MLPSMTWDPRMVIVIKVSRIMQLTGSFSWVIFAFGRKERKRIVVVWVEAVVESCLGWFFLGKKFLKIIVVGTLKA
jgi:hypothetical protein